MIRKYLNLVGIFGASVHSLRHTFAVQHLLKGTIIKTVQVVMGHKDIRTTEIYKELAKEIKRKELEENAL